MSRRLLLCELCLLPLQLALVAFFHSPWWLLGLVPLLLLLLWSLFAKKCSWWGPALQHFPTRGREVLITLDAAPHGLELEPVLQLLAHYQARALFFISGRRALQHPELVRRIAEAGHPIGCSMMEADVPSLWSRSPRSLRQEITAARTAILAALPEGTELRWFRSPGDQHHPALHGILQQLKMERIGWVVADDGPTLKDAEQVLLRLRRAVSPGAIILLRHGQKDARGAQTLPWLLEELLLWLKGQSYSLGG
jgi:peptidoglycan/xylan/chitin deacetylase (PgdA/CDA1 family)